MSSYLKVAFIGSGNVATHLAKSFEDAGHTVHSIFSQNHRNAESLVKKLYDSKVKLTLDYTSEHIDFLVISVNDDALSALASSIIVNDGTVVVHTSGSKELSILEPYFFNCGVFYPVQTFNKDKELEYNVPFALEASSDQAMGLMKKMAKSVSDQIYELNSSQRKKLHLAAVFACNFTNRLIAISKDILQKNDINNDIISPLIYQTIENCVENNPDDVLTGPAKRHDYSILKEQNNSLNDEVEIQKLYQIITDLILKETRPY